MSALTLCTVLGFVVGIVTGVVLACVMLGGILSVRDARDDSAG